MGRFDGVTIEHSSWQESDGRINFEDQKIEAGPVCYVPFVDACGRIDYRTSDVDGRSDFLTLEPAPGRKARQVRVRHGVKGDGLDEEIGLVEIDEDWECGFAEDVEMPATRIAGDMGAVPSFRFTERDGRLVFDGLGIPAGEWEYLPFLDAQGAVGYEITRESGNPEFLWLNPSTGEEDHNIFLYGVPDDDEWGWDDMPIVFVDVAEWIADPGRWID